MNTWNCTRCETPHDAPALVMSESGLPFCNDLCKTAYERDLQVDEMVAQFDETSKNLAEWRENRQAVFSGLRVESGSADNELIRLQEENAKLKSDMTSIYRITRELMDNHANLVNHVFSHDFRPSAPPVEKYTYDLRIEVIEVLNLLDDRWELYNND